MNEVLLWQGLKAGKKSALEALYRANFSDMVQYGMRLTSDETIIEDCIQELFIQLWNKRDSISETQHVKGYLLLSLRRSLVRALKKKNKQVSSSGFTELNISSTIPSFEDIIIQDETTNEKYSDLNQKLATLSDRQREVIYLKFKMGLDNDQIAEALEINNQSVRNLLSRTLLLLRKQYSWLYWIYPFLSICLST